MSIIPVLRKNDLSRSGLRNSLSRRMDRLFDDFFSGILQGDMLPSLFPETNMREMIFSPTCEIREGKDDVMISLDIPGMRREDLQVEIQGNELVVAGERREESDSEKGASRYVERSYGRFERRFQMPETVEPDRLEAVYENGVLTLTLPRAELARKSRRIEVRDPQPAVSGAGSARHITSSSSESPFQSSENTMAEDMKKTA